LCSWLPDNLPEIGSVPPHRWQSPSWRDRATSGPATPASGVTELLCGEHWDGVGDGFGSRADDLNSIVTTKSPSERGLSEVGSPRSKACGRTSNTNRHAHHRRCVVAGAIPNVRYCRNRANQDESRQHRETGNARQGWVVPLGIRPSKGQFEPALICWGTNSS